MASSKPDNLLEKTTSRFPERETHGRGLRMVVPPGAVEKGSGAPTNWADFDEDGNAWPWKPDSGCRVTAWPKEPMNPISLVVVVVVVQSVFYTDAHKERERGERDKRQRQRIMERGKEKAWAVFGLKYPPAQILLNRPI